LKITNKIAQGLYTIAARRKSLVRPAVRCDLERLNPGADRETLCRDYYVGKLEKSLFILLVGSVAAVLVAVRAVGERDLQENTLKRGEVTDEAQEITVETVIEGSTRRFQVQVQPTQMSEEEAEVCFQEFCQKLPELILGDNTSTQEIEQDLLLEENYAGYPFYIEWKSEDTDSITSAGVVKPAEEEKTVRLKAEISYGEMEWEYPIEVVVSAEKLSDEQKRYREVEERLLETEKDTRLETYWTLPESLGDVQLEWHRVVEDNSLILWAGALVVSVAVYLLGDKDLHEQVAKRREHMRREYPDIVYKITLYLGAGMTLQGAFQKIAAEYEQSKAMGKSKKHAYEEMLYTCRELKSGVSEGNAYEHFGKRTGLQEYIRLCTLMTQNLKKGSASLVPRLREEVDKSLTERIRMGRKLGEEAATKLLVPMVMMLAVVMVMVMLPAFSSMGS
jgi:hypothetical protein